MNFLLFTTHEEEGKILIKASSIISIEDDGSSHRFIDIDYNKNIRRIGVIDSMTDILEMMSKACHAE